MKMQSLLLRMCYVGHIFHRLAVIGGAACMLTLVACERGTVAEDTDTDPILVQVGDSVLLLDYVRSLIPAGLEAEDSVEMFNMIVDEWTRNLVLEGLAEKNMIDLGKINRMADDYRNDLIIREYLQMMVSANKVQVPEEKVNAYFKANEDKLVADRYLLKGAIIKLPLNYPELNEIRKSMKRLSPADLDRIDKRIPVTDEEYACFTQDWTPWDAVASKMPRSFKVPDGILRKNCNFEVSDSSYVYLLHIADAIPPGERMPYEYARKLIVEILMQDARHESQQRLMQRIYSEAVEKGELKPGLYNPLKGGMIGNRK